MGRDPRTKGCLGELHQRRILLHQSCDQGILYDRVTTAQEAPTFLPSARRWEQVMLGERALFTEGESICHEHPWGPLKASSAYIQEAMPGTVPAGPL